LHVALVDEELARKTLLQYSTVSEAESEGLCDGDTILAHHPHSVAGF
jgi:hypothetical protein